MHGIFRPQAQEHVSSPDQLEQLIQVVRPPHWLALLSCGGLVLLTLLWSIGGRLPHTVKGRGILVRPRQVVPLQAPAAGRLITLTVQADLYPYFLRFGAAGRMIQYIVVRSARC